MDKNFDRAMDYTKKARKYLADDKFCWEDDNKIDELDRAIENLSIKSDSFTREYLLIKGLQNTLLDLMTLVEDKSHKNMANRQKVFDCSGLAINAFGDYLD